jgi:hypothetical protein
MLPIQLQGEGLAVTVEPLESATVPGEPVVLRCTYANEAEPYRRRNCRSIPIDPKAAPKRLPF